MAKRIFVILLWALAGLPLLNRDFFLDVERWYLSFWQGQLANKYSTVEKTDDDIVLIEIDDKTTDDYKQRYPLSRKAFALLLKKLELARLIVFTIPIDRSTGTAADDVLKRIISARKEIIVPMEFEEIFPSRSPVAIAGGVESQIWRHIAETVYPNYVNFWVKGSSVYGFFPFVKHKNSLIGHTALVAYAMAKGFDYSAYELNSRHLKITWPQDGETLFLDPQGLVRVLPSEGFKRVSFSDIISYDLYQKFLHRGVIVPPNKAYEGKICIIGETTSLARLPRYTLFNQQWFRHELVAMSLRNLLAGRQARFVPMLWQVLAIAPIAIIALIAFIRLPIIWGIVVNLSLSLGYLLAATYLAVMHNTYLYMFQPVLLLVYICLPIAAVKWLRNRRKRRGEIIERSVLQQIKDNVNKMPPSWAWADIRVKSHIKNKIGGSMHDFVYIDENRLAVAVADVAATGRDALSRISYLKGLLISHSILSHQPGEVIYSINRALVKNPMINMSCKMLYVLLDANKNRLSYSGAGGVCFFVVDSVGKNVRCFEVEEKIPLGLAREISYEPKEIPLKKGDCVFMMSPVIFDVKNAEGATYTLDRVGKLLLTNTGRPLSVILEVISADVKKFAAKKDDLSDFSLIGIRWEKEGIKEEDSIEVGISSKEKELLFYFRNNKKGSPEA